MGGKGREIRERERRCLFRYRRHAENLLPRGCHLQGRGRANPGNLILSKYQMSKVKCRRRQQLQLRTFAFSSLSFLLYPLHFFLEVSYYRTYCLSFPITVIKSLKATNNGFVTTFSFIKCYLQKHFNIAL